MQMQINLFGAREIDGAPDSDEYAERLSNLRDDDWVLFAILALNHTKSVNYRVLLQTVWPEKRYEKLLQGEDPDDHALELTKEHVREAIEDGLEQLRNCASRLRTYLQEAGASGNPVQAKRAKKTDPTSGGYRLNIDDSVRVDVVEFAKLLTRGNDESRLTALNLIGGQLLDDSASSPGLRRVRVRLRGRVSSVVETLLPGVDSSTIATYVEDIVLHGDCSRVRQHLTLRRLPGDFSLPSPDAAEHLPLGLASTALSEVAQTTFRDLVTAWINSPADTSGPASVDIPVSHVVAATLPAQWGDVDSIRLNFLVFAADSTAPETDPETGGLCFRYRLTDEREVKTLREYVDTDPRAYFVLAVPKERRRTTAELLYLGPPERFDFYAVDLVQYYRAHSQDDLLIPVQNRVNLALFSLIWAARWVEDFFAPLSMQVVLDRRPLQRTIDLVFNDKPNLEAIRLCGWDSLVKNVPDAKGYIDAELHRRVDFRLGMGAAMQLINDQMISSVANGRLMSVRTYCPEALYGTANLWLFSRTYHQFMDTTARFQRGRTDFDNQRLLPAAQDLTEGSRLYAATLWHVVMLYRIRRARVSIVAMPGEGGHEDHGFYGGGIGDFMWIALDEKTGGWVKDQAKASVQSDHEEFINENERNVLAGRELSDKDYAGQCGMFLDDLTLQAKAPSLLFPPNDPFLETPSQLWSPLALNARAKGL